MRNLGCAELLQKAQSLNAEARKKRMNNKGFDTAESRALEKKAVKIEKATSYVDSALGALWGGKDLATAAKKVVALHPDYAHNAATHYTAGQVYRVGCSGPDGQYYCKDNEGVQDTISGVDKDKSAKKGIFKEEAKFVGSAQEIYDYQHMKGDTVISNPGIYNEKEAAFRNAIKQNPDAAKNGTLYVVLNNPSREVIPMLSEVVFYAGYDKLNEMTGAKMPLTNAQKANVQIKAYAANSGNLKLHMSNHSRGGLTDSISLQYALNNGVTNIPIEKAKFYGTAANVNRYIKFIEQNGYVNEDGISTTVGASTHKVDFVGRPIGANPATGGNCILCYSHSSYYGQVPEEFIQDKYGKNILDKNGVEIPNPEYKYYVDKWGEPQKDSNGDFINASAPKVVLKGKDNNTHYVQTPIKTDDKGNRYIEFEGKKYHADVN